MSKFCPFCGEELVDSAKFCKNCGKNIEIYAPNQDNHQQAFNGPLVENDHKTAIIISYVLAVLIPLIGVFASVYLLTRKDSQNAKKHGKYVLIVAIVVWIISFILPFTMY